MEVQLGASLVERALDSSLPDMVNEVSTKNKHQAEEFDQINLLMIQSQVSNNYNYCLKTK